METLYQKSKIFYKYFSNIYGKYFVSWKYFVYLFAFSFILIPFSHLKIAIFSLTHSKRLQETVNNGTVKKMWVNYVDFRFYPAIWVSVEHVL